LSLGKDNKIKEKFQRFLNSVDEIMVEKFFRNLRELKMDFNLKKMN